MSLFINTNISSLYAQRAAQRANDALDVSYQRLASGLRINSAKDDAAGIQVANNLTNQLNGLTQGNRNANDALAFAQTVEGAMDEVTNMLQRIRTLSIQSANGTLSTTDRESLQQEVNALTDEIGRIANETTFAGNDILNGNASVVRFQLGPDPSSIIEIDLRDSLNVNGIANLAQRYDSNGFDDTFNKKYEFDESKKGQPGYDDEGYKLDDDGNRIEITNTRAYTDIFSDRTSDKPGIDISSQSSAQAVLAGIDGLINAVDRKRADLGAMQNRIEATIRNQDNVKENVANSRSTIQDTDFAEETSKLTSQQIIQQATATILTQANQRPQVALSLLNK